MIIEPFSPFQGVHCETTTSGTLLRQLGIELSEPMLFGLGEGLGFIYWNMKIMDFPFIGGRVKPLVLTRNLAKNLKLDLNISETSSVKKAWISVKQAIDEGTSVGLQLDCYHLEYFGVKIHFAGHFAALYGYDDELAYLVDTKPCGSPPCITSLDRLALARNEKGPMAAKNLMFTLKKREDSFVLADAILDAIAGNAKDFLNPPIKNCGYQGMLKTSVEIKKWFNRSSAIKDEFSTTAMLMEEAGTGGALFRNLYRDFLKEAYLLTNVDLIDQAHQHYVEIASLWTRVASMIKQVGEQQSRSLVNEVAELFVKLSEKEFAAMKILEKIGS